jgi:hypothetical protein
LRRIKASRDRREVRKLTGWSRGSFNQKLAKLEVHDRVVKEGQVRMKPDPFLGNGEWAVPQEVPHESIFFGFACLVKIAHGKKRARRT